MRIERLRLTNFRQHELTDIEFGPGLTGIIGPNGAGKTTLLEAIAWVMFGMKAARGNRDYIRRRNAPPRSRVEVEMHFALGRHRYRVVRSLNSAELYQDGNPDPIANSLDTVTDRIRRLLGMTRDEFFNTYFTGQKDLAVMASLRAPQRAQFLSRVLGYERIRTAQERLKERRQELKATVAVLESSLPDIDALEAERQSAVVRAEASETRVTELDRAVSTTAASLEALRPQVARLEAAREELRTLEGERRLAEAASKAMDERLAALRADVEESRTASRQVAELDSQLRSLPELQKERQVLTAQSAAYERERDRVSQRDAARARLSEVEQLIARRPTTEALEMAHARTQSARHERDEVSALLDDARVARARDSADAQSKRNSLIAQFKDLEAQRERIVALGREGACPTCSRPLGEEFERVIGVLDRQLEEVKSNGLYYKRRIDQLKAEPPDIVELQARRDTLSKAIDELTVEQGAVQAQIAERRELLRERDRLTARLTELEHAAGEEASAYDAARHAAVREAIAALEPVALRAERLRDVAGRLASREAALRQLAEEHAATGTLAATLEARIAALAFDEQAFVRLAADLAAADAALRASELEAVRARSEAEAAVRALAVLDERLGGARAQLQELRTSKRAQLLHDELDRALNDLRTDLNQQLRPELSETASGFLRDLTNGRYTELELNEQYEPTLLDEGDAKAVISGGEEDIANLALRLAISQMIADRAGQPLSLLVLDEIFGSLDEERRAAVLELLRGLADRFPQVIMITHIDTVRDGFDRVIRVAFDQARGVAVTTDEQGADHGIAA